jgi:hypothetical protein
MSWANLAALNVVCRPITVWPGRLLRPSERRGAPFKAKWGTTVADLARELRHLQAKQIILQLAVTEHDIVSDGTRPYAAALAQHPGVILTFDSKIGSLNYWTDRFQGWGDNIRAIALGMAAARAIERYGIVHNDENYRGWRALPPSSGEAAIKTAMTMDEAARVLADVGGTHATRVLAFPDAYKTAYRAAAKLWHPDTGGSQADFERLQEIKRVLDAHHGSRS